MKYGVVNHPWIVTERDFQEAKELGIKYMRLDFIWTYIQPSQGSPYDFSRYDEYYQWASNYGIEITPMIVSVPYWLRGPGGNSGPEWAIPIGLVFDEFVRQYGELVYAIVNQYNPQSIIIWNEENIQSFWDDPDATLEGSKNRGLAVAKYVNLLREAYVKAKEANSNCQVISGGISECDAIYTDQMYLYGVKGFFDSFGIQPYFWHSPLKNYDPDYVDWNNHLATSQFPKIILIRDVLVVNSDSNKKIVITELGIGGSSGPEGLTTEEMKANRLKRVFQIIFRKFPYIEGVFWHRIRNTKVDDPYGLLTEDYERKPIFYAYQEVISTPISLIGLIAVITGILYFIGRKSKRRG